MKKQILILLLACAAALPAEPKNNWNEWRGPTHNSISPEKINTKWPASGPKKLWSAAITSGYSNICIFGNRGYATGLRGPQTLYCLDLSNGKILWQEELPQDEKKTSQWFGAFAMPVTDGKTVFLQCNNGMFTANDAQSGKLLWKKDLRAEGISMVSYGFGGTPALYNDMVILNTGFAFKCRTGEEVWRNKKLKGARYASPVYYKHKNKDSFLFATVPDGATNIFSLDALTGEVNWKLEFKSSPMNHPNAVSEPLLFPDSKAFYCNVGGGVKLSLAGEKGSVEQSSYTYSNTHIGFPIYYKGFIYGFSGYDGDPPSARDMKKSFLQCVNAETGSVAWRKEDRIGTVSIADDKLVILTGQGKLIIAEASSKEYKEVASAEIFSPDLKGRDGAWVTPLVCNGRLYLRNLKDGYSEIACFDVYAESADAVFGALLQKETGVSDENFGKLSGLKFRQDDIINLCSISSVTGVEVDELAKKRKKVNTNFEFMKDLNLSKEDAEKVASLVKKIKDGLEVAKKKAEKK